MAWNYAVTCKDANEIFDKVARNISQGMHQEEPQLAVDESPPSVLLHSSPKEASPRVQDSLADVLHR